MQTLVDIWVEGRSFSTRLGGVRELCASSRLNPSAKTTPCGHTLAGLRGRLTGFSAPSTDHCFADRIQAAASPISVGFSPSRSTHFQLKRRPGRTMLSIPTETTTGNFSLNQGSYFRAKFWASNRVSCANRSTPIVVEKFLPTTKVSWWCLAGPAAAGRRPRF